MACPICGLPYPESYDYCKNCAEYKLRMFEIELQNLLNKYPDVSLIPKGANLVIRHKYGEEIYF